MRESKRVESFLLKFGIVFSDKLSCYMKDFDGESGTRISKQSLRKILEFYYAITNDSFTIKSFGIPYYSISDMDFFIKSLLAISTEIQAINNTIKNGRIKDLQRYKASSIGLWCTDKEPIDKTDFWQLK